MVGVCHWDYKSLTLSLTKKSLKNDTQLLTQVRKANSIFFFIGIMLYTSAVVVQLLEQNIASVLEFGSLQNLLF